MKALIYILLMLTYFSCENLKSKTVREVLTNTSEYDGKAIYVKGKVESRINLFGLWRSYYLADEEYDERILVKTKRKVLPNEGDVITIKGNLEEVFTLGEIQTIIFKEK